MLASGLTAQVISFFATLNGSDKDIFFRAGDDAGTDMFIESSTGNVGIGTTAPNARLDVVDSASQIRFGNSSADNGGFLVSTAARRQLCRVGLSGTTAGYRRYPILGFESRIEERDD